MKLHLYLAKANDQRNALYVEFDGKLYLLNHYPSSLHMLVKDIMAITTKVTFMDKEIDLTQDNMCQDLYKKLFEEAKILLPNADLSAHHKAQDFAYYIKSFRKTSDFLSKFNAFFEYFLQFKFIPDIKYFTHLCSHKIQTFYNKHIRPNRVWSALLPRGIRSSSQISPLQISVTERLFGEEEIGDIQVLATTNHARSFFQYYNNLMSFLLGNIYAYLPKPDSFHTYRFGITSERFGVHSVAFNELCTLALKNHDGFIQFKNDNQIYDIGCKKGYRKFLEAFISKAKESSDNDLYFNIPTYSQVVPYFLRHKKEITYSKEALPELNVLMNNINIDTGISTRLDRTHEKCNKLI